MLIDTFAGSKVVGGLRCVDQLTLFCESSSACSAFAGASVEPHAPVENGFASAAVCGVRGCVHRLEPEFGSLRNFSC